MLRIRLSLALLVIALLAGASAPAALARPSAYSQVLQAYEQKGSIPPCQFSSAQLGSALKGVDTYGAQYFSDFTSAIQTAIAARAAGQCTGGVPQPTTIPPPTHLPAPASHSVRASTQSNLPLPILLIALLTLVALLFGAVLGLARWRGWEPGLVAASRHCLSEAGYRVSGSWAEFRDWLRSA